MEMRTSHLTLLLAILMGLTAWVLDAWISWAFFPGKTFLQLLWEYDPSRTLYVRSVVVILFVVFGAVTGHLIERMEQLREKDARNMERLRGIDQVHRLIVKEQTRTSLLAKALEPLRQTFELETAAVFLPRDGGGGYDILCGESAPGESKSADVYREAEAFLERSGVPEGVTRRECAPANGRPRTILLAPLRTPDSAFGVVAGVLAADESMSSGEAEMFASLCDDLAHGLARLRDAVLLRESAEKLKNLYQNAPVGLFTSGNDGRILSLNPAMVSILGADSEEDIRSRGCLAGDFYVDKNRRRDFLLEIDERGGVEHFEAELKGLDGIRRTVVFAARQTEKRSDRDWILEGFALDVSRQRMADREKRILRKRLDQAQHFKSITVLAGGIAHEFNNILQAMMGSAYLAQMKAEKGSSSWQYMQDIQNSGARAAKLCDQMLSYAGKKAMTLRVERADQCLRELRSPLAREAQPMVGFSMNLNAPEARVRLDRALFSEMVNSLVLNAFEAMEDRSGRVQVETFVSVPGELDPDRLNLTHPLDPEETYWILRVADQGVGIPSDALDKIFEPFYTTKFQGRGLGLSAVTGMVEKLDGVMGVRSVPGDGAEFYMFLPLAQAVEVDEVETAPPPEKPRPAPFRGRGTIWVVDDEPLICTTVNRLLDRWGFTSRTAADGEEALKGILEDPHGFDCALIDITMPNVSGVELVRALRNVNASVPVVIMSGFDERQSLQQFEGLNVSGFIHKPFQMEELQKMLREALPRDAVAS